MIDRSIDSVAPKGGSVLFHMVPIAPSSLMGFVESPRGLRTRFEIVHTAIPLINLIFLSVLSGEISQNIYVCGSLVSGMANQKKQSPAIAKIAKEINPALKPQDFTIKPAIRLLKAAPKPVQRATMP